MLNTLRSKQKSILWFLVIIITPAFIIWGAGSGGREKASPGIVAKLNGEKITYQEFYPVYTASYEKMVKFYENYMGVVSKEQKESIHKQAAGEAVSQLINNHLLLAYAKKAGLSVTADDIKDVLRQYDVFKTDGVFDETKWQTWITNVPADKMAEIEESFSREILARKALDYMRDTITVSDQEIRDYYLANNLRLSFTYAGTELGNFASGIVYDDEALKPFYEIKKENFRVPAKVSLEYVALSPENIIDDYNVSEKEAAAYFEKNRDAYERDDEVNVEYVKVRVSDYMDDVYVSGAEIGKYYNEHIDQFNAGKRIAFKYFKINASGLSGFDISETDKKAYYESHKEDFKVAETARARHILFSFKAGMSDEEKQAAFKQAGEVMERAKNGEDFAALAREFSQGPTREKGGDLGYFEKGDMVKEFDEAVFGKMKAGDVYGPVETRYGYHVIKLEDLSPEHYADLEEASVQNTIVKAVEEKKRAAALAEKENDIRNLMQKGTRIEEIASLVGADLKKSPLLTEDEFRHKISPSKQIVREAYALTPGMTAGPVNTGKEIILVGVTRAQDDYVTPLSDSKVREKITQELKTEKAFKKAQAVAERYRSGFEAAGADAFADKAKEYGMVPFQTGFFEGTYNSFVPGFGYDRNFKRMAFSLKYDSISSAVRTQDGYTVMRLLEKRSGYLPKYQEVKTKVIEDIKLNSAYKDLYKIARTIRSEGLKGEIGEGTAAKYKLQAVKTGLFARNELPAFLTNTVNPETLNDLAERMFDAKKGYVLKPFNAGAGYYIIKIAGSEESYIRPFDEVKPDITALYINEKAREAAYESLKKTAPVTVRGVDVGKSFEGFSSDNLKEIAEAAGNESTYIESGNRIYFINNIKIDDNVLTEMSEEEYKAAGEELRNTKYQEHLGSWLQKTREKSKIAVYID